MSNGRSSLWRGAAIAIAGAAVAIVFGLSPAIASDIGLSDVRHPVAKLDGEQARAELEKARAAKKLAGEEKGEAYLKAHHLYKNCERELRPFCMMSSQMIMRNADARYKNRERQEFSNIAALEAAIASSDVPATALDACGAKGCLKSGE